MKQCLTCDLISGMVELPGGRIYETDYWAVEHCVGPLGVGTLIVKPKRHCIHFWELRVEETTELGPLLHRVASTVRAILKPDQVYICLWSHAGWQPGHLHFVLQPSWNHLEQRHQRPGPFMQVDMFEMNTEPSREEVEAFVRKAKEVIQSTNTDAVK